MSVMSKLVLRASQFLLIGTLFVSLGGHLALLQTVAWGNMLRDYSRGTSLKEAAKMTFDGEHPCELCKVVKKSKQEEEKNPLVKAESKKEVALPTPIRLKAPAGVPVIVAVPEYFGQGSEVSLGVPLRPPRCV